MKNDYLAVNVVPIVFCADRKYAVYLPVVVQSIIDNASSGYHYIIIVFDCGIDRRDLASLKRILSVYTNFSLRVESIAVALERYKHAFVERNYWSIATYGRFFIPELCDDYDKVIYADIDIIFNRDVAELLEIDLGDNYIGGVAEPENDKVYLLESLGLQEGEVYVNAGVIVFNISAWKRYNLSEKAIRLLETRELKVLDQDAINLVCMGNIKYLSAVWNCQSMSGLGMYFLGRLTSTTPIWEDWEGAYHSDKVIFHYNSPVKPWMDFSSDRASLWWEYAAKTPLYGRYLMQLAVKAAQAHRIETRRSSPSFTARTYNFLGIPFFVVKTGLRRVKYMIGKLRIAKKEYGSKNIYLYILGFKIFTIRIKE